jgi:oxygen-dependent protoporphyrinogen oxidase
MSRRVLVVGAGISGLALAHALRERGADPLVLEASERAGGKIRSTREDGFLCESGPTGMLLREPALERLLRSVGLEDRLTAASKASRRRELLSSGKLRPVPGGPGGLVTTSLLGPLGKLRLLGDLLLPRGPAGQGGDESVADFAARRLGRQAARQVFFPLVSGLYAGDAAATSLPAAFPFLAALEREHRSLLVGAVRRLRQRPASPAPARGLHSFPDGMEELPRALARALGDRLRTRSRILGLTRSRGCYQVAVAQDDGVNAVEVDAVALAVPAYEAAGILAGLAPAAADALAGIPYAPIALVSLGYHARAVAPGTLDGFGFLVPPGEATRLLGVAYASTAFAGRAPEGGVLVSARLGGTADPDLVTRSDDELVGLAHEELARLTGLRAPPCFRHVVRHTAALPQYTLGHSARVDAVAAAEARLPGLRVTGNALRGAGIPDCVRNAGPVADALLAGELPN